MCAHHRPTKRAPASRPAAPASGTASAADTKAPGSVPWRANSKTSARSSVATTPPIIPRITSASRLNVSRGGRVTSRRQNAHAIESRTITATTFCIALSAAQIAPSNGAARTASMIPPVTMLAVPIVSRTKPQKIPACMSPACQSRNIRVWTSAYWTSPANRAGMSPSGSGPRARAAAKTRRWRAIASRKNATAPQKSGEDERVGRYVLEDREHQASAAASASVPGRSGRSAARRGRTARPASRARGRAPATWRRATPCAPFGLPGRLTIRLPPRTPTMPRLSVRHRRVRPALGTHRLGKSGYLVVDDGEGRLRRHVTRRQARPAGRDHEAVASRGGDERRLDPARSSGTTTRSTSKPRPTRRSGDGPAGGVLARAGRTAVAGGDHDRGSGGTRVGRWAGLLAHRQLFLRPPEIRPALRGPGRRPPDGPSPRSRSSCQSPLLPPVLDTGGPTGSRRLVRPP